MLNRLLNELVTYGIMSGIVDERDRVYTVNRLADLYATTDIELIEVTGVRDLHLILEDLITEALRTGVLQSDTTASKDLFDTKIMGLLTPPPSVVIDRFEELYEEDPKKATDYYYDFSRATNYIRTDRIAKDLKWVTSTEYGDMDITVNLSKPEKDPRDIAAAAASKSTSYPKCLLCRETEGFAGDLTRPGRANHRIIPVELDGQDYFLQYSPYVYYNEHCIILNKEHIPMIIDRSTFRKLLTFVDKFPHYIAGSNADIPIVGGSILSHDHFQGGSFVFPMARASVERTFTVRGYEDISAGIVKWPMSVIRLAGKDIERITDLCDHILSKWKGYSDESAYIFAETDGVRHNAITPIARINSKGEYEMDLVLRNNITSEEHPMGVFHPHAHYHNIKKENIGLIEVMGLAILPARLKTEMELLASALSEGRDFSSDPVIGKHHAWAKEFISGEDVIRNGASEAVKEAVGRTFAGILEDAGVFKRNEAGTAAFRRFTDIL